MSKHPFFISTAATTLASCAIRARDQADRLLKAAANANAGERASGIAQAYAIHAIDESLKLTLAETYGRKCTPNELKLEGIALKVESSGNVCLTFKGLPLPVSLADLPVRVMEAIKAFMPKDLMVQLAPEFMHCMDISHVFEQALQSVALNQTELRYASTLLVDAFLAAETILTAMKQGSNGSQRGRFEVA